MKEGYDVATISFHRAFGEATVVGFTGKDKSEEIDIGEIQGLEPKVRKSDIVIIDTGFDWLYSAPGYDRPYRSLD